MSELETVISRLKEIKTTIDTDAKADLGALESETETLLARKLELEKEASDAIARNALKGKLGDIDMKNLTPVINEADADMIERKAFMEYVTTGRMVDGIKRAADKNVAADLGVMLPNTIQQQIITEIDKVRGTLFNKVKKINVRGGVEFPIGSFSATFKRITETTVSERQKGGSITGSVSFKYKIGEIRLAKTLLQSLLTVPAFEAELAKVIAKAYVEAMDNEILNGDTSKNEMQGITKESKVGTIELTAKDMKDWKSLFTKVMAKLPTSMLNAPYEYVMSSGTFMSEYMTLANDNNTPVGQFVNYGGNLEANINGHACTLCEPTLFPDFESAKTGDVFGMLWIPNEAYVINSNMEFSVTRYFDHETNQEVTKALVVNDGGVLRPDLIYLLKKKATSTAGGTTGA